MMAVAGITHSAFSHADYLMELPIVRRRRKPGMKRDAIAHFHYAEHYGVRRLRR